MKRILLPALLTLAVGCSAGSTPAQSSALTGRVDAASFANRSMIVVAVDRRGAAQTATLQAGGSFRLTLPAHATYQLALRDTSTGIRTPLVFPRSGSVQRLLRVRAGGASSDLGTVRAMSATAAVTPMEDTSGSQCMDGVDPAGKACVDDQSEKETQSCDASAEDATKDTDNVDNQSGAQSGSTGGGADATEGPESTTEVAVPSKNPATELGGCSDASGDTDNVDNQSGDQTGPEGA